MPNRALLIVALSVLQPALATAQGLKGTLMAVVRDESGGVLVGATVRISSPELIGGAQTQPTNAAGQAHFFALSPGLYALEAELRGFKTQRQPDFYVGAGAKIEMPVVLKVAGAEDVTVVASPRDSQNAGVSARSGPWELSTIPGGRTSMFGPLRMAPGVSPTSPSSDTVTSVSALGSSGNENAALIDGQNFSARANGGARADPGFDFMKEVYVQTLDASVEHGNFLGAVINVISRQGSNSWLYDASYYLQPSGLTSQSKRLEMPLSDPSKKTAYGRARYRDFTTNLGGPVVPNRLWFFVGYQYLRDYDSQPGTDPAKPRTNEQDKIFAKLTWLPAPNWRLEHSVHYERWLAPEQPTLSKPFPTTVRFHGTVPAVTFGHLTHTSANSMWEVRAGHFSYSQQDDPNPGFEKSASHQNISTTAFAGGPPQVGNVYGSRTSAKATFSHSRTRWLGFDHFWKTGGEVETGGHRSLRLIPTGVRYVDRADGFELRAIFSEPSNAGGSMVAAGAFLSDALTFRERLTMTLGLRYDHNRGIIPPLHELGAGGVDTGRIIEGRGTVFIWNKWSPRLGMTAKLTADGRTLLRMSAGRYVQGVMTGELSTTHPGVTEVLTKNWVQEQNGYTLLTDRTSINDIQIDPRIQPPHTNAYSMTVDREITRELTLSVTGVRKDGTSFIGWIDEGGVYDEETKAFEDGHVVPVFRLANGQESRRYLLTNPEGYSLTYNGLVIAVNKRQSHGWQAAGSYTFSRANGLLSSSGTTAAGPQLSTVGSPPVFFGRDPNDLTNARGRLPNDRPHMFRLMGSVDVPGTGLVLAANLGYFSGKPWSPTAAVSLVENGSVPRQVQLERRGFRRLSSQTLLDVRVSKVISLRGRGTAELTLDVLNALNEAAEEGIITSLRYLQDGQPSPTFGVANVFVDPRRVMLSVRLTLGRERR